MSAKHPDYILFSKSQLDKIGNTVVYLSEKIPALSKTKLLKLIYILDELSIKKSGIPFFNLSYKVWRLGPVPEDLFIDLSSQTILLQDYMQKETVDGKTYIRGIRPFVDDEFSDNDMELLDHVVSQFGDKTAKELIAYTHRENSPWYIAAKENDVLELLERNETNSTNHIIDMGILVTHDVRKKSIYEDFREYH